MQIERQPNLRFTRISLQNWKNFKSAEAILQRRAFFVGPNASGKSNLLDAFRFLRDIASVGGGLQAAVEDRMGVSAIRSLSARRPSAVKIEVDVGNESTPALWSYLVEFTQDNNRYCFIKSEVVKSEGHVILARPDQQDTSDTLRLSQTALEQINVNQQFRELADFFSSIRYQHLVPQLIREPDRSVGRKNDPFGGDFLERVAVTPARTRDARLRRISEALKVAVPQLLGIELVQDVKGLWHVNAKYAHWRGQGAWQSEESFSDGTLRLLGLLWAVLESGGPLLLEEPELSLHPAVVAKLPAIFYRMQRYSFRQVLLTTHSESLLRYSGIGLDEIHLIEPEKEGSRITLASARKEISALLEGGMPLGEAILPRVSPKNVHQLNLFADM
jgi:predicted ATPase